MFEGFKNFLGVNKSEESPEEQEARRQQVLDRLTPPPREESSLPEGVSSEGYSEPEQQQESPELVKARAELLSIEEELDTLEKWVETDGARGDAERISELRIQVEIKKEEIRRLLNG